jgi:hypothetical protein
LRYKLETRLRQSKATTQHSLQAELDEILDKVHREGIHSLTRREKKILKQATDVERKRNES